MIPTRFELNDSEMENVAGGSAVLVEYLNAVSSKLSSWEEQYDKVEVYLNLLTFTDKYWGRFDEQDRIVVKALLKKYQP